MGLLAVIGISLGLSLDAFTVALTNSTVIKDLHIRHGFRMALFFGVFQFLMPIIGWAAGMTFNDLIKNFDHWIAFSLLAFVGGRMIWNGVPRKNAESFCSDDEKKDCRDLSTLFILSIATSIDALAVGLSFAMIRVNIITPSVIIGTITFSLSMVGYFIGKRIGNKVKIELDIVGGLILIGIGVKIVIEHLAIL